MITITEAAAKYVQKMLTETPNSVGLRISLKQSGCTGFKYILEAAEKINENDQAFESNGVTIIIDKKNAVFVDGTEIDYVQNGLNSKMVLNNPHVKDACGCGESFTFEE